MIFVSRTRIVFVVFESLALTERTVFTENCRNASVCEIGSRFELILSKNGTVSVSSGFRLQMEILTKQSRKENKVRFCFSLTCQFNRNLELILTGSPHDSVSRPIDN